MKQLYDFLTFPLSIIEDPFWDFVLMAIMGSLSFVIAWNLVGETQIRGKAGSILHWTIRLIVMFLLCTITSLLIKLVIFIYNVPLVIWIALGIAVLLILLIFFVMKKTIFSEKEKKNNKIDKQKNRYIIIMKRMIKHYYDNKSIYLKRENVIDENNLNDKYIYEEIENMLIKENLLVKDDDSNTIIDLRTIMFLEKYVKDSIGYTVNCLVFIITLITLIISVLKNLKSMYVDFIALVLLIVVVIMISKALPKDK